MSRRVRGRRVRRFSRGHVRGPVPAPARPGSGVRRASKAASASASTTMRARLCRLAGKRRPSCRQRGRGATRPARLARILARRVASVAGVLTGAHMREVRRKGPPRTPSDPLERCWTPGHTSSQPLRADGDGTLRPPQVETCAPGASAVRRPRPVSWQYADEPQAHRCRSPRAPPGNRWHHAGQHHAPLFFDDLRAGGPTSLVDVESPVVSRARPGSLGGRAGGQLAHPVGLTAPLYSGKSASWRTNAPEWGASIIWPPPM